MAVEKILGKGGKMMYSMTEDRARFWDSFCKITGVVALVIGGAWTVATYFDKKAADDRVQQQLRRESLEIAKREARKPFLDKRLDLYLRVMSSVATIGTSRDQKAIAGAKSDFWNLKWGSLDLVADEKVQPRIDSVADCLRRKPQCDAKTIRELGDQLAHSCRESISQEWGVTMGSSTQQMEPQPDD